MRVVLATGNPGKAGEITEAFGMEGIEWQMLKDFPDVPEPEETGETFEENAVLKARYYQAHAGALTLAEDSGLEVPALDGAPGVRSARYAGEPCDDDANNAHLLEVMAALPDDRRQARFVSVFALAFPGGRVETARGTVEGRIALACAGSHGFGYDAVFIPDGYDATFGVLDPAVKRGISHRMRSLKRIMPVLQEALALEGSEA